MTPHCLLLTSAEEVGGPILIPIHAIDYAVPLGRTTRLFLSSGQFIDVTEQFDNIIAVMGGLVMQPGQR